jgi:hypothetical protein
MNLEALVRPLLLVRCMMAMTGWFVAFFSRSSLKDNNFALFLAFQFQSLFFSIS